MTTKDTTNIKYFHVTNSVDLAFACRDLKNSNLSCKAKEALLAELTTIDLDYFFDNDPSYETHVFFFTDTEEYKRHIKTLSNLYHFNVSETSLIYAEEGDYCWMRENYCCYDDDIDTDHYGIFLVPLPKTWNYVADLLDDND